MGIRNKVTRSVPWRTPITTRRLVVEPLERRLLLAADRFEDNDTPDQAADLGSGDQTHEHLTIDAPPVGALASDVDFYRWTAASPGPVRMELLFRQQNQRNQGNLDLEVYDTNGNLLGQSQSRTDNEQVELRATARQTFIIRVFGRGGAAHDDYALIIHGNDAPFISPIPDQTVFLNAALAPVDFTVSDQETPSADLKVRFVSSDPAVVPAVSLPAEGDGVDAQRSLLLENIADVIGTSTIRVIVQDADGATASRTFQVTVNPRVDFNQLSDRDNDGLPDRWEVRGGGLDVNGDGSVDLDLWALGARPDRKDIFVEVDAMQGRQPLPLKNPPAAVVETGLETNTILDYVVDSFLDAPLSNPNGTTGLHLHVQMDDSDIPITPFSRGWKEFDLIKCGIDQNCAATDGTGRDQRFGTHTERTAKNSRNILRAKQLVFRYALFADRRGTQEASGLGELLGNDLMVTLGDWPRVTADGTKVPGGTATQQSGTFMHELGHTLGLRHGGGDDVNLKPNYFSVMNYHWQVPTRNVGWRLDYSPWTLSTLNEANLNEPEGIGFAVTAESDVAFPVAVAVDVESFPAANVLTDLAADRIKAAGPVVHVGGARQKRVPFLGPVDWNEDGDTDDVHLELDINGDNEVSRLHSHNDWANLKYKFRDSHVAMDGVHQCDDDDDCDDDELTYTDHTSLYDVPEDEFEENNAPALAGDLGSADQTHDLTLHEAGDEDWFSWTALVSGLLSIDLTVLQDVRLLLDAVLFAPDMSEIESVSTDPEGSNFLFPIQAGTSYSLKVSSPESETGYYQLSVDGPEVWNGDAAVGLPGNGTTWDDAANWTVDGLNDVLPAADDDIVFGAASTQRDISLVGDQVVNSISFLSDYTLTGGTLTVASGVIDVADGVTATINSPLVGVSGLLKSGPGTLVVNQHVAGLTEVFEGTLSGGGTHSSLLVGPDAVLSLGENSSGMAVTGNLAVSGEVAATIDQTQTVLLDAPDGTLQINNASLSLAVAGALGQTGNHVRTLVRAKDRFNPATSVFDTVPVVVPEQDGRGAGHLGAGVFFEEIAYHDTPQQSTVTVNLYQAAPGDSDGDGDFDQNDIILVLQAAKYRTGASSTWVEGDWNHDGLYDQWDVIAAQQTGSYLQ